MAAPVEVSAGHWTTLRTLGRGASGAVVFLAADATSGELFAVKSARAPSAAAAALRRERDVMAGLSSPHVLRCIGASEDLDGGSYSLFLEYAPGGSLADVAARNGGRLDERAVRAYAGDVARGLAYLHARSIVHGDVKPRNVVIGADGRAKLADFGCARPVAESSLPIGGTPAFMAPEVARGEEQGPAADVWALGCTVVEMATGRAPWSGVVDDVLAAVHRIGYTDAVPEVPECLSPEAKDFLARCFARNAGDRPVAAQLLEHPFLVASASRSEVKPFEWVSPKSTLDAAFWESDETDDDEWEKEVPESSPAAAGMRIKSLACSALPDWRDCESSGWIDVLGCGAEEIEAAVHVAPSAPSKVSSAEAVPAGEMGAAAAADEQLETEGAVVGAAAAAAAGDGGPSSVGRQESKRCSCSQCHVVLVPLHQCVHILRDAVVDAIKLWLATILDVVLCLFSHVQTLLTRRNFCACGKTDRPVFVPHSTTKGRNYTTTMGVFGNTL